MPPFILATAVGVLLAPLVVAFAIWLFYCAKIDKRHAQNADEAARVIEAAGRWFPARLRNHEIEAPLSGHLRLIHQPKPDPSESDPVG